MIVNLSESTDGCTASNVDASSTIASPPLGMLSVFNGENHDDDRRLAVPPSLACAVDNNILIDAELLKACSKVITEEKYDLVVVLYYR